jgi:hypothetical protein
MIDSEPEFSPVCMAYEAACSALEVARISMITAKTKREEKRLNLKWLSRALDDLPDNKPDGSPAKYPHLYEAIDNAENFLEEAENFLEEAHNTFIRAQQELEIAYQAFMEEEAMLACGVLFAFDSEKCLHPHHQVQLIIFSLLCRGDSPKDWNLEHNNPTLKRLVARQLLSMTGIQQ